MKAWQAIAMVLLIIVSAPAAESWQVPPAGEHPRLVFNQADLPAIRGKLDTPRGKRFFDMIRANADNVTLNPKGEIANCLRDLDAAKGEAAKKGEAVKVADHDAREWAMINLENAAFIYALTGEEQYGKAAIDAMLRLAPYVTGSSLRSMALIYDWCYPLCSDAQKTAVRKEIARLCGTMLAQIDKEPYALGPCPPEVSQAIYWGLYLSAFLGIGELAIEGEPEFNRAWLARSRECTDKSLTRFLDEAGYHENGPGYVGFGFSTFNFYMEALRLRGADWSKHPRLGKLPFWFSYLILPGSIGVAPRTLPVGNSNFGSIDGQDAYLWLYHAMPDNRWASLACRHATAPSYCNGFARTLVAQFLWDRPFLPDPDFKSAPRVKWFPDGGVFMRSGWEAQDSVFWLKTQQHLYTTGNHNDFGSFYLHAYGEPFAVEAGGKYTASGLHNLVFIDGQGMDHNSGDVMPATPLLNLVDGDFAAAAVVDQKEAYSDDKFFEGADRHIVTRPLNTVLKAQRIGCTIWDGQNAGRYFLIVDDIDKDGKPHEFSWRMMVNPNHKTTLREDGVTLWRDKAPAEPFNPPQMDVAMLSPWGRLAVMSTNEEHLTGTFHGGSTQNAIDRLVANATIANPHFTVCLYPRQDAQPCVSGMPGLMSRRIAAEGGHAAVLTWPECADRIVVSYGAAIQIEGIKTDAKLAVIRSATQPRGPKATYGPVVGFLLVGGTFLDVDGIPFVKTEGGPCSVSADVSSGRVAVGTAAGGTITLAGFAVKQVSRYSGEKSGEPVAFSRKWGRAPGAVIRQR